MFKFINNLFARTPAPVNRNPAGRATTEFDTNTAALQGDLSVVTIENLMQLMSHAGLSGTLRLATADNDACFIIRNGALVFGYLKYNFPRMGERLVQAGYITAENLRESLHLYQEQRTEMRLGEILKDRKFISDHHLEEVIKEQVKDSFFKVLSWHTGEFSFYPDDAPPEEEILLDERIDHLIIEGIVAMDGMRN